MDRTVKNLILMIAAFAILTAAAFALNGGSNSASRPHPDQAAAGPRENPEPARVPIPQEPRPTVPALSELSPLEQQWGIHLQGIRLTAAGYMLDFRFRVLDPEKAAPLLDRKAEVHLEDAAGNRYPVPDTPKVGRLRQSTAAPVAGRVYWLFFANSSKTINAGDRVTIVIGGFTAEGVVVQ